MIQRKIALTVTLSMTMLVGACNKQESPSQPSRTVLADSGAVDESASILADPESIQQGASASLTWRTKNATEVSIEGIGAVQTNGSLSVSPTASTIYHLTAKGAGGNLDVTAHVMVKELPRRASLVGR